MSEPRYALGIDLGTTNTVCAALTNEPGGRPSVCLIRQPYSSPGLEGFADDTCLPSVLAVDEAHGVLVGHYAKDQYACVRRDRSVSSVKRYMGTRWTRVIDGRVWRPEQVSGCILKAVREGATDPATRRPVSNPAWVVITVPACFGTEQRRATLEAARLAGFDPARTQLFDEPAAALLHQSWEEGATWAEPKRLLILDVGGGTLDASYMTVRRDGDALHADLQGRSRYNELGGDDIDLTLAGLLLRRLAGSPGVDLGAMPEGQYRALCSELLAGAERAKIELCGRVPESGRPGPVKPEKVPLRHVPGRREYTLQVSLQDVFEAVAEFMPPLPEDGRPADADRFHYSFNAAISQALESADRVTAEHPPAIDLVYLTGGSSRLPMLGDAVRIHPALFRKKVKVPVVRVNDPMNAVALGAARYAGTLAGFEGAKVVLRERMFEGIYLRTGDGPPHPLIPPMTDITSRNVAITRTFETGGPGTKVDVDLFTGSSDGDPDLQPIRRRSLAFAELLPPGHHVHLTATVTPNRDVELNCWTELGGRRLEGTVEVADERPGRAAVTGVVREGVGAKPGRHGGDGPLPPVNAAVGGGES